MASQNSLAKKIFLVFLIVSSKEKTTNKRILLNHIINLIGPINQPFILKAVKLHNFSKKILGWDNDFKLWVMSATKKRFCFRDIIFNRGRSCQKKQY